MKTILTSILLVISTLAMAEEHNLEAEEPAGFVTALLNNALDKQVEKLDAKTDSMEYGRNVSKYITAPHLGGYIVGSYKYSSQEGKHGGDGFGIRMVRVYVDGTVLRDFNYRVQMEMGKTVHLKDAYLEWCHWKELRVKLGQYKRCFTFEDPYNPWDVGTGDYSQAVKKLSGFSDYSGAEYNGSNGGRDIGLQLQGDVLPVGNDKRRLFHYQAAIFNGQGINTTDANRRKDWMGTIQLQPVKDLYIGVFGWKGTYKSNGIEVERNRYAIGAKYEHQGWSARAEYIHHTGHRITDYDTETKQLTTDHGNGRADGWYATVGVPCTKCLKKYAKYDAYRDDATMSTLRSVYSLCPNFQPHRNLMFQLQYNYVHDKTTSQRNYHEAWLQSYIRF